jgi:SpoVK/Ycf46/Vps4 family AAA+-type ATPase
MTDKNPRGKAEPGVIEGVRSAVEQSPENHSLRVHLSALLNDVGEFDEALGHAAGVLQVEPDHLEALEEAARAAEGMGEDSRARAYRRLKDALAGSGPTETESSAAPAEGEEAVEPIRLHALRGGVIEGDVTEIERPALTLDDVGGMEQVKRRLRTAFLAPLENPALRRMYGKSLRGGLLLYGPPGCGKTFIARATAGQLGARFIGIGLHDVLDMWLGQSERNLHELFENARRSAPCVLFFDEVDALGRKRTQLKHSAGREVVVQFLSELDSFGSENEGVFVLGATNHPWDVDTALRRPGRFDRMLLVLPPDRGAREAILRYHLQQRPVGEVDVGGLAERTELYSGADLAHICESAAEYALEDSVETGVARPISMADLEHALSDVRPSTVSWLQTARNYALYASDGGAYDELIEYLRLNKLV